MDWTAYALSLKLAFWTCVLILPLAILLARDASAPDLVRKWAQYREEAIFRGEKPRTDAGMVLEAEECAKAMEEWRKKNRLSKEEKP